MEAHLEFAEQALSPELMGPGEGITRLVTTPSRQDLVSSLSTSILLLGFEAGRVYPTEQGMSPKRRGATPGPELPAPPRFRDSGKP